jgi:c-di-GMP-binding flagellar brake protein YcgR
MTSSERRIEERIGISFPVECMVLPDRKSLFYTVSRDLSSRGAKILSDDFMGKGKEVKVNINLIHEVAEVKAEVSWCNKRSYSDKYYIGLRFTEISERHKKSINNFVNNLQHVYDYYGKR